MYAPRQNSRRPWRGNRSRGRSGAPACRRRPPMKRKFENEEDRAFNRQVEQGMFKN